MADPNMPIRLRGLLPASWFSDGPTPVLDTVLAGLGAPLAWAYSLYAFVLAQARLRTSSGVFLDLFALDFFGTRFPRRPAESDPNYEARIEAELVRPRATRAAMMQALTDLTGRPPVLRELWNTADVGAYNTPTRAYAGGLAVAPRVTGYGISIGGYGRGRIGYGVRSQAAGTSAGAGRYGSLSFPNQVFITAYRPQRISLRYRSGYGAPRGGYGRGRLAYTSLSETESAVSDADILATVAATKAEGITAWVRITD